MASSLRVIHVVYPSMGYTFSGTTRRIFRLLYEWAQPGVELSLWGTDYLENHAEHSSGRLWEGSAPSPSRRAVLLWSLRLVLMLIRNRRDYDLLHVHALWWGSLLAPLVAHLLGKKAVFHMTLLGADNPSALASQRLGWLKGTLFGQFDGLIAISPALAQDRRLQSYAGEITILPNPLVFRDPPIRDEADRLAARRHLGIPAQDSVLLFVGSAIRRKGLDLLVELFIQLATRRPRLRLALVGPCTRAENPRLDPGFVTVQREKLERAGVGERVSWIGLVRDESELMNVYLASDLFVFPTRAEGQGNVILESMACGLPVVCSHLAGVTDMMVVPGETGQLVRVDDVDGFAVAVSRLLDDAALRRAMGAAGRTRALGEYGFERYCHRLADFYRLVAGSAPGPADANGAGAETGASA